MTIVSEISWDAVASPDFGADRAAWRDAVAQIAAKAKEKLPGSEGRIERAVALVLAGDVTLNEDGSATVGAAQHPDVTYTVALGRCGPVGQGQCPNPAQ